MVELSAAVIRMQVQCQNAWAEVADSKRASRKSAPGNSHCQNADNVDAICTECGGGDNGSMTETKTLKRNPPAALRTDAT